MSGILRRTAAAIAKGLKPSPRDFVRARAHFHHALPRGPLPSSRYVVFDLETTGLAPSRGDALVSIGAVVVETGRWRDLPTLANPGRQIPLRSIALSRHHRCDGARRPGPGGGGGGVP